MNASNRHYLVVSASVFTVVALLHLWRALLGLPLLIGNWPLPVALSWVAALALGALAAWGWRQTARATV